MKKLNYLSLMAAGLLLTSAPSSAQQINTSLKMQDLNTVTATSKVKATRAEAASKNLPGYQEEFYLTESGEWYKSLDVRRAYDANGNVTSTFFRNYLSGAVTDCYKWENTYDEINNLTLEYGEWKYGEDTDFIPFRQKSYKYEDIIKPHYVTCKEDLFWNNDLQEWEDRGRDGQSHCSYIERDADNKVLSIQSWMHESKDVAYLGMKFGYDEAGNATSMELRAGDQTTGQPVTVYYYDNIVWDKTDYQYLNVTGNIYFAFNKDENNSIKSFTLYAVENNNLDTKYKLADVERQILYDETTGISKERYLIHNPDYTVCNVTEYDPSNQMRTYYYYNWVDTDGDGLYTEGECVYPEEVSAELEMYDGDLMLSSYRFHYQPDVNELVPEEILTNEYYYTDLGEIESVITMLYDGSYNLVNAKRVSYSEYSDVTTDIRDVEEAAALSVADGYVEAQNGLRYTVTDLSGRIIKSGTVTGSKIITAGLPTGIYAVSAASQTVKLIVK